LALKQADSGPVPNLDVLRGWSRHDNWLIDFPGAPPNHAFNAIAALTLLQSVSTRAMAEPVTRLLIASKGITFGPDPVVRQDSSLEAWSWTDGTFSWVEPTAWSVLVLKQRLTHGPYGDAAKRIRVGEQMLIDRAHRGGGWNYGNANVFGKELVPYVPTTALALLALQDQQNELAVSEGLEHLQRDVLTERSVLALSLAIICLRVYRLSTSVLERHLTDLIVDRYVSTNPHNNVLGLAMALYALSDRPLAAFTVRSA
jgi:hypothetical protein